MKKATRRKALSLLMVLAMLLTMAPATPLARAEEALSTDVKVPFTSSTYIADVDDTSNSYRIPALVTLADGTIVAAADARWNTTFDGGGLDTLVARSTDGGVSWNYTMANYLGDNGNEYNGTQSTCFIDPCLTVAADGQTVYMLVDLYPYGVALNGGKDTAPSTAVGFTSEGYLKLSDNDHSSYGHYLKDGKIYTNAGSEVSGYTVDGYFNLYYNGSKTSNLFFADSPFKVVRTGFLYLTKSTDGGASWSEPRLLNLKTTSEQVCLVGPGRGITTKSGMMVFPVYSFHGDNEADGNSQRLSFIYSSNGVDWSRTAEFDHNWASEAAVVELSDGTLRFFFRNGTTNLCYVDYNLTSHSWGRAVTLSNVHTNSNTQLSAISYSKTAGGKQVILVSCPSGRDRLGSNSSSGGDRLNGSIFVFTVDGGTMTLKNTIEVNSGNSQFMYSCLTERSYGSVAILFEDKENAWGTGDSCYYTMDFNAYPAADLGLTFDEGDDPGEGGGIITGSTIEMFVGDSYTLSIPGANYQNNASIADSTVASMTVVGKDEVPGSEVTTVTYTQAANVTCATVIAASSNSWIQTNYYYTPDGMNYYPLYAKCSSSGSIMNRLYTYTWGYLADGSTTPTQIGTQSVRQNQENSTTVNIAIYTQTKTTTVSDPTPASTTVTFNGLIPGQTTATIGGTEYTIIVKEKAKEVSGYLQTETSTTLDALAELGLSGNGYTVSYTTDSALITISNDVVTTGTETGTATIIATVQKNGIPVGIVTYNLTISSVLITDEEDIFVAIGNKASISGLTGTVDTSMLDTAIASISAANGESLSSGTVTINAVNNAENIGKHTSFVIGTTLYRIHLVPTNEKNTDAAKYIYINIQQIENCTVYYGINASPLHKVEGTGILIDETFYDGFNIMFFAVPDEGYVLTEMTSTETESNGNLKTLTDFYSIANGTRLDGADSDAWPFADDPEPTSIPTSGSDSAWVSGHGFRWSLMEGNMTIEGMRAMFTSALALGAQGATTITKNAGDGINVEFSFVAERLPTFEKTITAVNGEPFTENTIIEFGDQITYQFTITSYSEKVKYTTIRILDEDIGFDSNVSKPIADGAINTAGTYTYDAVYTINVGDVDKYVNGKFVNHAELTYYYSSAYDSGIYDRSANASVSCNISGMVYYTWADNVPAEITGDTASYPLPGQAVVTYNTSFLVAPYTGATEYEVLENGIAIGKWEFRYWECNGTQYYGNETETMIDNGSMEFVGVWEYTSYPTFTVTYQWTGAPATGVSLPVDTGTYYAGQTYYVDTTYKAGDSCTVNGVTYTFSGWKLNGSVVTGQQTMGQSHVYLAGIWTSEQIYTSLTIFKTGHEAIDPNQAFLFRIQGEGVSLTVTIHGNGCVIVDGLKANGTYTVTEITGWSWRYSALSYTTTLTATSVENGAAITLEQENNEITFENSRSVKLWLDGDSWVDNIFSSQP